MPVYVLKIKADLENVAKLVPLPHNMWKFDIENVAGERKSGITVTSADVIDLQGSRGTANFVMKWPGEQHQAYIKLEPIKGCDVSYTAEQSGSYVKIIAFECRGLDIVKWIPMTDFSVETVSGAKFDAIDLSDPDGWTEFDENISEPVSVMNLEHVIERL